ncbi:MAG: filamentous hemagglutinin N-terminal domain-containing protein [Betaproteobacteria bacterium]
MNRSVGRCPSARAVVLVSLLFYCTVSLPNITVDGSVGPVRVLTGPHYVIGSEVGTIRGNNLFHSFGQFSVRAGESATFNGPSSVSNVVSRVTGAVPSSINGVIDTRTSMPSANFFFINPSGVIFGPDAQLQVGGSVHASTADYIGFPGKEGKFFASLSRESALSVADPVSFGFLGSNTGVISIDGSHLTVAAQKTLSFVGADVEISAAGFVAPSGAIRIDGMRSDTFLINSPNVASVSGKGSVSITRSTLDVTGTPAGKIVVRSGQLMIARSSMRASSSGAIDAPRVGVELYASERMTIDNRLGGSSIESSTSGGGRAGDIWIVANQLEMMPRASIKSLSSGAGRGGDVRIWADQLVSTGTTISTDASDTGSGGDVYFNVRSMSVTRGSIRSVNGITEISKPRSGGAIHISAGLLTMDDGALIESDSTEASRAPGGDVDVQVDKLIITQGASLATYSESRSVDASAGNLAVTVQGPAVISDRGSIVSASFSDAPAGEITARFGSLELRDDGTIQAGIYETGRKGQGGDLTLAADSIVISNGAGISSQATSKSVSATLIHETKNLVINRGYISTSTVGTGAAGNIRLDVNRVILLDGGQIASGSLDPASGAAGTITLSHATSVTISGSSPDNKSPIPPPFSLKQSSSGIFSITERSGPGGDITIAARQLELRDGGNISASSTSRRSATALAGNIAITFGDSLIMDHASIATSSNFADGGNIKITSTGSTLFLNNSQITTSVQSGLGSGGQITLGSPVHPIGSMVLADSQVQANAFGGAGGNIGVFADLYLNSGSTVSAFSAQSTAGTIDVQARVTDVSGALAELPDNLLQAANLLRASCAARTAEGKASSLVVAGREGVPPEPGGFLSSPFDMSSADAAETSMDGHEDSRLSQSTAMWAGSNCAR